MSLIQLTSVGVPVELPELTWVRDLEVFEGPILSELRVPGGAPYLKKWCGFSDGVTRSLVVRSDARAIANYLARRMTMLDLLTVPNANAGWLVDVDADGLETAALVPVSTLPEKYLPESDVVHDIGLRPEWETTTCSFLTETWDAELFAKIERLFRAAYSMAYAALHGKWRSPSLVERNFDAHYSYYGLYAAFQDRVPADARALTIGVAGASPGVLNISARTEVVDLMVAAIIGVSSERGRELYKKVHLWSVVTEREAQFQLPVSAFAEVSELADLLLVEDVFSDAPSNLEVLRVGKVTTSYFRALQDLMQGRRRGSSFEFLPLEDLREQRNSALPDGGSTHFL